MRAAAMSEVARCWRRVVLFGRETQGVSAVEFALVLPILMVLWIGGYQISQAARAYGKVTQTTYTVASLTTQYTTMGPNDIATVLGASAQVMAPYDASSLTIVLTEYQTTVAGISTVVWSKALNGTALIPGQIVVLPTTICPAGSSVVLADVSYGYQPPIGYVLTGPITMRNRLYMSPRQTVQIAFTGQ